MEPMTPEEEARVELLVQSAVALEQAQSAMVQKIAVTAAVQETEERMAAQAAKAATEAAARAKSCHRMSEPSMHQVDEPPSFFDRILHHLMRVHGGWQIGGAGISWHIS